MKLISILLLALTLTATAKDIRVLVWDEQQPQQKEGYGEKFPNPLRPRAFGGKGAEGLKKEITSSFPPKLRHLHGPSIATPVRTGYLPTAAAGRESSVR